MNDDEKLAYLRDELKDGPAKYVVEGWLQDVDYYKEAFGCLQRHHDHRV